VTPEAAKALADARVDQEQAARWEAEIRHLQARIQNQYVDVHLGAPLAAAPAPVPINTVCPVSGKLADRTKTLWHDEKLVCFLLRRLQGELRKDPKPHLARLAQLANAPPGGLGAKPVNDKCPVSGKEVDLSQTSVFEGKVIAFCCAKCKTTFESDPNHTRPA